MRTIIFIMVMSVVMVVLVVLVVLMVLVVLVLFVIAMSMGLGVRVVVPSVRVMVAPLRVVSFFRSTSPGMVAVLGMMTIL
jgi:hypothetical protein